MQFAIVYSLKDEAGKNIVNQLKQFYLPQFPIFELKKETIFSENFGKDSKFKNIDFIIFASKHKSESKKPALSLHAPGNFRNADFGGKPGKICKTSAFVMKYLFKKLNENAEKEKLKDYEITLECTHHGPLINKPCCFIELGSSEEQWKDESAAKIIAKTIASLQDFNEHDPKIKSWIPSIGIGGPHYCPGFNKIQLDSNYAISHIIPSYSFPITESMLREAIEKTQESLSNAILDWKSFNSDEREKTINLLKK